MSNVSIENRNDLEQKTESDITFLQDSNVEKTEQREPMLLSAVDQEKIQNKILPESEKTIIAETDTNIVLDPKYNGLTYNGEPIPIRDINKLTNFESYGGNINVVFPIDYKTIKQFSTNAELKWGEQGSESNEIFQALLMYNEKFHKPQHTAALLFDGKKPQRPVLENLLQIAYAIESESDGVIGGGYDALAKIIKYTLGNKDDRTIRKYVVTLQDFIKNHTGQQISYYSVCNFKGFRAKIIETLDSLNSK